MQDVQSDSLILELNFKEFWFLIVALTRCFLFIWST